MQFIDVEYTNHRDLKVKDVSVHVLKAKHS